jgi:hypothetical protein
MDASRMNEQAERFLQAWTSQQVDAVLACYPTPTDPCAERRPWAAT